MTELDYGSLLCWGINELGKQEEPCVFAILPAGIKVIFLFFLSISKGEEDITK